jgi:hypothetical protein
MCFTAKQCLNDFFGYGLLSVHMRYYVKCRISPAEKQKLPVEWEAYDCTRSIKLPGKPLMRELGTDKKNKIRERRFVDTGRIKPNRRKQEEWIQQLANASCGICSYKNSIGPVSA